MELNQAQQQAVNTIEGPVMVIAGAGTGKTEVIAHRIAKILSATQTNPSSILCLTFTDNAAKNMRRRLLGLIGPTAYSVTIGTFHSFCNEIILSHPDRFVFAPDIRSVDDLEKIEIIQHQIESLPDQALLRPWGDHFYYQSEIISHLQTLKRENITPPQFQALIDDEQFFLDNTKDIYASLKSLKVGKSLDSDLQKIIKSLQKISFSPAISSLIIYHISLYNSGGYALGPAKSPAVNFKNALLKIFDQMTTDIGKQQELLQIYQGYQSALQHRGLYDYDDMILFVLRAFADSPDLLLEYQERYQYFLVDEYQDTNSAQNKILELLTSYFDRPNLFVVGDDDQSIFRFQGASIANIYQFYRQYHPELIVLRNNYRSHQLILDSGNSIIGHNRNRIASYIEKLDKSLRSSVDFDSNPINLYAAPSPLLENYFVVNTVKKLLQSGVTPSSIAILYRNNHDITDLAESLRQSGIKFYLPEFQNILHLPHIYQLICLLRYINDPSDPTLIYPLLCSPFININPLDLQKRPWLNPDTPGISQNTARKYRNFNLRVAKAQRWWENYPLDKFFNRVIRRFKYLHFCLSRPNPLYLNSLRTFYDTLKRLQIERQFKLTEFLDYLRSLQANDIPLSMPELAIDSDQSIRLLTVHKAKGLEFDHVFLYRVVDKKWSNSVNRSHLRLPPGIISHSITAENADQNEDERRLFYVALTRARRQIYISYTDPPSQFIAELEPHQIEKVTLPPDSEPRALTDLFPSRLLPEFDRKDYSTYLSNFLRQDYRFNVTHLNAYLRCPLCFYYQTILKVPAAKDKFSSFGTAIHAALSAAYTKTTAQQKIVDIFTRTLQKENLKQADYEESLARGLQTLPEYLHFHKIKPSSRFLVEQNYKHQNITLDHIPLTGTIDLIEKLEGNTVNLYDFKTGNPDGKSRDLGPDGDYFRQLVFYNLLISLDTRNKYQVSQSVIDFVQPSRQKKTLIRRQFKITPEDINTLKNQIKEIYDKILNLEFSHIGPDCSDPHHLHYLLK